MKIILEELENVRRGLTGLTNSLRDYANDRYVSLGRKRKIKQEQTEIDKLIKTIIKIMNELREK